MEQKRKPSLTESLATDVSKGSDSYSKLPEKMVRYSRARSRALAILPHVDKEQQKTGSPFLKKVHDDLITCGNYLHFRNYYTVEQIRLIDARFCKKHLFCPLCAIRRGSKQLSSYLTRYKVITGANSNLRPYMITLTVKNGPDLMERYNHLVKSLKKVTKSRSRALSGSRHVTEFSKVQAAVGTYEFTNKKNGWHPHVHIIALCEEMPNQKTLSSEWLKITGDSFIVDVRPIGNPEEPIKGFAEVFKYALKFSDLTLDQQVFAAMALHGKRLLFSLGLFRGVVVPESLLDEPLDDLPYFDIFYRYLDGAGYTNLDS